MSIAYRPQPDLWGPGSPGYITVRLLARDSP
jgi:hypothetical protein